MPGRVSSQSELIHDRRGAVRLAFSIPALLRDAAYSWRVEVVNISSSGCLLKLQNTLPIGKRLELELKPQGREPVQLKGALVHVQPGGFGGFQLDLSQTEDFERALDLFEWLLAQRPGLAVEVKKRPVQLAKTTTLWAVQDSIVQPRPEEARFMTLFVGGRSLGEVEKILGARFESLMYLAFSLLDRKLLTLVRPGQFRDS